MASEKPTRKPVGDKPAEDESSSAFSTTLDVIGSHADDIPDLTFPVVVGASSSDVADGETAERARVVGEAVDAMDAAADAKAPETAAGPVMKPDADPDIDADLMERVSHALDDYDDKLPPDEQRRLDRAALMNAHRWDIVIVLAGAILIGVGLVLMFG